MESKDFASWIAPHAAWFLTGTGSYIDGNLLTEILKKGYNNSFQVTVKLWSTPQFYSEDELKTLCQIDFKNNRNKNDILFCTQSHPEHSSTRLDPTPIVITTRDMNNEVVGFLSLVDLIDLMKYTDSLTSTNAARVLFAFVFGVESRKFSDFWYGNPVTKLSTKEYKEMIAEEEQFVSRGEPDVLPNTLERDW